MAGRVDVPNADPLVDSRIEPTPGADYPDHIKTYKAFISLSKWFVLHTLLILVALYFFVIADNGWAGIFFLVLSLAAFLYSVARRTTVPQDVGAALDKGMSH